MKFIYLALFSVMLSGCTSMSSRPVDSAVAGSGLIYYMPKRDFVITVTVDDKVTTAITIEATTPYPDIKHSYMLGHERNLIGKNISEINISNGLLTTVKSTVTSQLNEAFKNLATSYGKLGARDEHNIVPKCDKGVYKLILSEMEKPAQVCDVTVAAVRRFQPEVVAIRSVPQVDAESKSGVYYRMNRPYLVVAVSESGMTASALLSSPSESPDYFLPVARTLFANNSADYAFEDGIPTKFKQDTDGEAIALLKLPADVVEAYFTAVGAVFTSFKTVSTNEVDSKEAEIKLEMAKVKYEACISAIKAKDQAQITALKCGE